MKLVCHIGTPKTASTFLQNTCAANEAWLRQHGILYPDLLSSTPNHITLFFAASPGLHDFAKDFGLQSKAELDRFREQLSEAIALQLAEAPADIHTVLVSSENLTGNLLTREGVRNLATFLRPHFDEIEIVAYLRRQDDAILSMYGEFMRRGFSPATFTTFLNRSLGPQSNTPYLYYRKVLGNWIDVFGRDAVTVRIFDRARMVGGDVLTDFFTTILDEAPDVSGLTPSADDNVGLSAPVLEFLRIVQPLIPYRKNGETNLERRLLSDRINSLPSSPRPKMSSRQSQRIMRHFEPANTWLRDTFFPDHEGPIFPPKDSADADGNLGEIDLKDFAKLAGDLFT